MNSLSKSLNSSQAHSAPDEKKFKLSNWIEHHPKAEYRKNQCSMSGRKNKKAPYIVLLQKDNG
ncbi:hypothetical protein [Halothiobacillus sp.]|jgi:hypothetical protein|uniref:hypothetical protein n=1 Tax=Halothiobacillus sp. TaxID=1891311 RepID=UPI0026388199|nr:hypothetical protein [Halothiobacillus sp.]MDD3576655.1 hypothetical protein [Halothiobacillus sp.]MDD4966352.1 hypothetical protein [Halothiobacillus sp.]MDY0147690.1 hypothetical protein [Halothiobacillus sp.]